jgi:DNA-binding CsgD family transcriptional regulator
VRVRISWRARPIATAFKRPCFAPGRKMNVVRRSERMLIESRLRLLTLRERQILERVATGCANKSIAAELHLSQKTVEAHRSRVMHKMEAESLAELIHMLYAGGRNARLAPSKVLQQRSSLTASVPSMDSIEEDPFAANVMGPVKSEMVR